jgi:rod shape-determining protein MreC
MRTNRPHLLIATIAILMALVAHTMGWSRSAESHIMAVTGKAISLVSAPARWVGSAKRTVSHIRTLEKENRELRDLVNQLQIENVRMKEVEAENHSLRRLLNFAHANPTYAFRGAQVVGRVLGYDPDPFLQYIILDVGTSEDVDVGMPVVTDQGLVGRVAQAYSHTSKVLLITDPDSRVSGLLQTSRLTGIVRGQGGHRDLLMDYLPQGKTIAPGEIVITSGIGGSFPKNLVIGQVVKVDQKDYEMFQKAVVHPSVDFGRLETVLVITRFTPLMPQETPEPEEKK